MPGMMLTIGCNGNLSGLINAVLSSASAVINVMEPGSELATDFSNAVKQLTQAVATWKNSGVVADITQALGVLMNLAATIPFTATYSPLIDILVAGIDAVLAAIPQTGATMNIRATIQGNARHGRVGLMKPHFAQTQGGAYRSQWNNVAKFLNLSRATF